MEETFSQELLNFVVSNIDSVELLEVLVLLHSQPEREWSVDDIDRVIRSNVKSVRNRLERLVDLGLAAKSDENEGAFRYAPRTDALRQLGDNLIIAYQTRRVDITEIIYTKPMKEMVGFSNAFKFRGGK